MLTFAHVLDLFAHKFSGLSARGFAFFLVFLGSL